MKYLLSSLFLLSLVQAYSQEIIPFELKDDNRIYIQTSINQSDTLNFVFDLGANITVLNKTRSHQNGVNIQFDSIVENQGTNGISEEQISANNEVRIGSITVGGLDVLGISYPEDKTLDGVIGWNFFREKKVRINYESHQITIYDELPEINDSYDKVKLKFINNLPYVKTTVYRENKPCSIWAMLDIGYNGELLVYYEEVEQNKLIGQFQVIGEAVSSGTDGSVSKSDLVLLPRFGLGNFEIYNMPAYLTKTEFESPIPALMGGNLLKRFHMILDFENSVVYLKPNRLINSEF